MSRSWRYLSAGHVAAGVIGGQQVTSTFSTAALVARFVKSGRQGSGPMPFVGKRNLLPLV